MLNRPGFWPSLNSGATGGLRLEREEGRVPVSACKGVNYLPGGPLRLGAGLPLGRGRGGAARNTGHGLSGPPDDLVPCQSQGWATACFTAFFCYPRETRGWMVSLSPGGLSPGYTFTRRVELYILMAPSY